MQGTIHIIGAGLAGLSAATALAEKGFRVCVYEASAQAGGRCRSYHDTALDTVIDNGNHLLLSGNRAARAYLKRIGSDSLFTRAGKAVYDFVDAKASLRWQLRIDRGAVPIWLFDSTRRVPDTTPINYLSILSLLWAKPQQTVMQRLDSGSVLYQRLWQPFLLAALNTTLAEASAQLAAAIVRGTLLQGGQACVPLVAEGLSGVFIDPALQYITARGGSVTFNRRVQKIHFGGDRAAKLEFATGEPVSLSPSDQVICAVPPWGATALLPEIRVPDAFRSILNAHFLIAGADLPPIIGVIGATTEWIFVFRDRISVTVSDADRLMHEDREALAVRIWQEVAGITGLAQTLPPWQIVKEKRATFAATPEQEARRPETQTPWRNVFLAGDYVKTGLPSTIEGAVLSGKLAAERIDA